ncbi:MAG TPA: Asp-tRNA(Asn)/Glu-tRNA(Gln) amidotransferase subunit GatC [Patescibacteria group bacterium]|jgi:aspartyl-tRNA(Asn)/glutamyl-tRNA(Gln) amidotransferase subunit C|nr:Asp-tRNA(Asn)/Glu-tRNA(Gln) amidotransferase subunit GatC [Patescibacteria group bacterium]
MSSITIADVEYVAALSKIAITKDEASKLQKELEAILGYVQLLNTVDTAGVEPTYQVTGLSNVQRQDVIIDYGITQADLLKNARDTKEQQIKVPKVL